MPALTDTKHEAFARNLAAGCSKHDAAVAAGYVKANATSWGGKLARKPKIAARIAELQEKTADIVIRRAAEVPISIREQRVAWLEERARGMRQVIVERATDPQFAKAPGGKTGLLVKTFKQIGSGANAKLVPEYAVDTGLLRELRATEQQAAQEVGQWTEKRELTGDDGGPLRIVITPTEAEL